MSLFEDPESATDLINTAHRNINRVQDEISYLVGEHTFRLESRWQHLEFISFLAECSKMKLVLESMRGELAAEIFKRDRSGEIIRKVKEAEEDLEQLIEEEERNPGPKLVQQTQKDQKREEDDLPSPF